ncbi:uncharacterized protein ACR2FA_007576 [Aphomia sociella]
MKSHTRNKRRIRRTRNKIKKLFEQLRNDSNSDVNSSTNITDDNQHDGDDQNSASSSMSHDKTVIFLDDSQQNKKRKQSNTNINEPCKKTKKDNTIVINDDTDDVLVTSKVSCSTPKRRIDPINCSTPISQTSAVKTQNNDCNVTKEINRDSFLTIDLTTESRDNIHVNTIIDLANTTDNDCTFVTASNASLSMSGDSDVTVLENKKGKRNEKRMLNIANGIAKLDATDKGRLLELITQNIFNGCNVPTKVKSLFNVRDSETQATASVEDTYIKEVILGQNKSRNSVGSNIYNPMRDAKNKTGLRMIIIDGSNVAMEYSKGREFSVKALKICIDYFLTRGHVVRAFVPRFRCKFGMSSNPRLLDDLERHGLVVYTPSKEIQGRCIASYDDRYIVQCAAEFDGIIVSGDNYRDLLSENPRWRYVIENRVLPFTWVNGMIMFPKDPLGRYGPTLENFLKHPEVTPPIEIL